MASAGPRAGSLRAKLVVNSVLLLSMIAISAPRATRVPAHEWLSLGFVVILALHILYSWNWVISVAQRFFASMRGRMRFSFVWNVALYAMMTMVMLSGLLISVFALPALGIPHNLDPFWETTHERLADWLLVMLGIHLGLHWQWLVTAVSRFLSGTLGAGPKGGRATLWWLGPTGVLTVAAIVFGVATMGLGKTGYAARLRDEHQRQETARKEAQRKRAAAAEAAQAAQAGSPGGDGRRRGRAPRSSQAPGATARALLPAALCRSVHRDRRTARPPLPVHRRPDGGDATGAARRGRGGQRPAGSRRGLANGGHADGSYGGSSPSREHPPPSSSRSRTHARQHQTRPPLARRAGAHARRSVSRSGVARPLGQGGAAWRGCRACVVAPRARAP
ncbi:MAG: DUF4405 domain-containing protein [Gemmatimonadetes bacterium]|nr:DUF4405 domain-containing protein [Gemmatimonadota bacterium]